MVSKEELQIGCIKLTIDKWRDKRVALGEANGYTPEQIEEYGLYIELAAKLYLPKVIKTTPQDGMVNYNNIMET